MNLLDDLNNSNAKLLFKEQTYNNQELLKISTMLYERHLKDKTVQKVICCLPTSPLCFCWHLLALTGKITLIPIIYQQTTDYLNKVVNLIQPDLIVTTQEKQALFPNSIPTIISELTLPLSLEKKQASSSSIEKLYHNTPTQQPSFIFFGSGTSGKLKGIMHSITSISGFMQTLEVVLKAEKNLSYLVAQPMGHIGGFITTLLTLLCDGKVILLEEFDTKEYLSALSKHQPTHINLHTPIFYQLLKHKDSIDKSAFKNIKVCFTGGDTIAPNLPEEFTNLTGAPMQIGYGSTETGIIIYNASPYAENKGCLGKVIGCAEVEIRKANGELAKTDEIGELYIKSPANCLGYYPPENFTNSQPMTWFPSGDLAKQDAEQKFWYIGRASENNDQAHGIMPQVLETELYHYPNVAIAAVTVDAKKSQTVTVVAFVELKNSNQLETDKKILKDILQSVINKQEIVVKVQILDQMPLNKTGKVDRAKLNSIAS